MVPYNNKKYYINIVETKPSPAVSIIETDCEVDFAPPLDYKEPEKPAPSLRSNMMTPEGFSVFHSFVYIWKKKKFMVEFDCYIYTWFHSTNDHSKIISVEEEPPTKKIKFKPFSGSARRLDGKPLTQPAALPVSPLLKQHNSNVGNETVASKSSSSASRQHSGKLVFGSNGNQPPKETTKVCCAVLF